MISLTNHDFQWGHSEVVIIYPDIMGDSVFSFVCIAMLTPGVFGQTVRTSSDIWYW